MFTDLEIWEHHEDEDASRNCYIAAAIYFVTLLVRQVTKTVQGAINNGSE